MSNAITTILTAVADLCDHYYSGHVVRRAHGFLGDAPAGTIEVLCADCGALTGTLPASLTLAEADERTGLAQSIDFGWESYGETVAQMRGEMAQFGDAWPGAQVEVAAIRRRLDEAEARLFHLDSVHGLLAVHGPALPPVWSDDEPF